MLLIAFGHRLRFSFRLAGLVVIAGTQSLFAHLRVLGA
jgi:hypothetical protein